MKKYFKFLFIKLSLLLYITSASGAFLEDEFPNLKKFVFKEPTPSLYIGLGLSPISLMESKIFFTVNLYQLHYIKDNIDWEIISASYGRTLTQNPLAASNHFTFRTIPKYRVF